jgi:hypothetical protein
LSEAEPTLELFHAIGDDSSAKVRRFVVDRELGAYLRFRNVTYDEVKADLIAHGGFATPALWDGATLVTGADAIIARLLAYSDVGR